MWEEEVEKAYNILKDGGIILYPTDTIWGLGCDATNINAVQRIYTIKNRIDNKALLTLVDSIETLSLYVEEIPSIIKPYLYSDSPTTIIYPKAKNLAPNLIGKDGSVGIRITKEQFSHQLCKKLGKPLVSTSANRSNEKTPTLFTEIDKTIIKEVDYVVNYRQEETTPSVSSTIIKIDNKKIQLLRGTLLPHKKS